MPRSRWFVCLSIDRRAAAFGKDRSFWSVMRKAPKGDAPDPLDERIDAAGADGRAVHGGDNRYFHFVQAERDSLNTLAVPMPGAVRKSLILGRGLRNTSKPLTSPPEEKTEPVPAQDNAGNLVVLGLGLEYVFERIQHAVSADRVAISGRLIVIVTIRSSRS